ncbi:hypothetical protein [Burkholderia ambifaria]|uniref:hypothetical protein n=1 Tax=Burkholderia ambifaria TaxID=152480 RepID=UPI00158C729E|nr:hypothetical protein [Burkholderia ambifaria]
MSQLVQIAPGVVFSSDVLGVEWTRKYRQDDGNAEPDVRTQSADWGQSVTGSDHGVRASLQTQMSLL